jgi:hypothetical protein
MYCTVKMKECHERDREGERGETQEETKEEKTAELAK